MPEFYEVDIPSETELLFRYLTDLKEHLNDRGSIYTVSDLYDDLPTRAYFMLRVADELDFCTLYPADGEKQIP